MAQWKKDHRPCGKIGIPGGMHETLEVTLKHAQWVWKILSLERFEEIEGHRHGDEAGYKLDRKTWEWWSA